MTPSSFAAASATALRLTRDQDVHVAAHRLGGGQRLVGRILERLVVVLGDRSVVIRALRFVFELVDQLGDGLDLDARLAAGGLGGLHDLESRRDVDAVIGGVLSAIGFFFAFMMLGSDA